MALAVWARASWLYAARGLPTVAGFAMPVDYRSNLVPDAPAPRGVPLLWLLGKRRAGLPLVWLGSVAGRRLRLVLFGVFFGLARCGPLAWVVWKRVGM